MDNTLEEAINYAKLRNVKTNLTLNTLIKENEFEDAFNLAKKAYEFGIDAIIVQDLGLAKQLIRSFPDLDIHASTQMTAHNLQGVLELQELGFKRVVLSSNSISSSYDLATYLFLSRISTNEVSGLLKPSLSLKIEAALYNPPNQS